mgnify:CR=1 FL=1
MRTKKVGALTKKEWRAVLEESTWFDSATWGTEDGKT